MTATSSSLLGFPRVAALSPLGTQFQFAANSPSQKLIFTKSRCRFPALDFSGQLAVIFVQDGWDWFL